MVVSAIYGFSKFKMALFGFCIGNGAHRLEDMTDSPCASAEISSDGLPLDR